MLRRQVSRAELLAGRPGPQPAAMGRRGAGGPAGRVMQCGHTSFSGDGAVRSAGLLSVAAAAFPSRVGPLMCSVGSDAALRIWDYRRRRLHKLESGRPATVLMGLGGTCCDVAGDGRTVAVGHETGSVTLWDAGRLACQAQVAGGGEAVGMVRFCPASRWLAVAWGDAAVGLLRLRGAGSETVTRAGPPLRRHSNRVRQMDFSRDGRWLRTCDGTGDVLYWGVMGDGTGLVAAPDGGRGLRDASWATETCAVGWDKKGLWPAGPGRARLCSTAAVAVTTAGGTIAAGGGDGVVLLGRYPAVRDDAEWREAKSGHAGGVSGLTWSGDDRVLWSQGAGDVSLQQWRHVLLPLGDGGALQMRAD